MTSKRRNREKPEIFAIRRSQDENGVGRRNFLGLGIGLGAGMLLSGATSKVHAQNGQSNDKVSDDLCDDVKAHSDSVLCVAFSPDDTMLASGSRDKSIKLWSLPEGRLIKTLTGHSFSVNSVAFHPDGTMLASGSLDNTIKLWSLPDGKLIDTIAGHSYGVTCVAFSPDGKILASGSFDDTIKLWSLHDGSLMKTLRDLSKYEPNIRCIAFNPDGTLLASGNDYEVILWRLADGKQLITLTAPTSIVNSVAFSPDGALLVSAGDDKKIRLWHINKSYSTVHKDKIDQNSNRQNEAKVVLTSAALTSMLAAKSAHNKKKKSYNMEHQENQKPHSMSGVKTGAMIVSAAALSAALSNCSDPTSSGKNKKSREIVYNAELLKTIEGHVKDINSVAFSPDGTMLVSGSEDGVIFLWRVPGGEQVKLLSESSSLNVHAVSFNKNGTFIASGLGDYALEGRIKLWQMPSGAPVWCLYDAVLSKKTECKTVAQKDRITDNTICTCDLVCTCDTITVASDAHVPGIVTCTCDTVMISSVCTCDTYSTSCSSCSSCSSCGYWYPN